MNWWHWCMSITCKITHALSFRYKNYLASYLLLFKCWSHSASHCLTCVKLSLCSCWWQDQNLAYAAWICGSMWPDVTGAAADSGCQSDRASKKKKATAAFDGAKARGKSWCILVKRLQSLVKTETVLKGLLVTTPSSRYSTTCSGCVLVVGILTTTLCFKVVSSIHEDFIFMH